MKKLFTVCGLMVALISVMAFNAEAMPITGAISFSGTQTTDVADFDVATLFTSFSNVTTAGAGTGRYLPVPINTPVTRFALTFRPATPLAPAWSFTAGGFSYSFDTTSLFITASNTNTITMEGLGIAHKSGFEDTVAYWYLSANNAGGTASFSSSLDTNVAAHPLPVPEPATMLLLGSGLVGLVGIGRRKFRKGQK